MSKFNLIFLICLLYTANIFAGGWVFGGGDQVGDKYNPWFIFSDQKIKYCVAVDPFTFSAQEQEVNVLVAKALEYWRSDFEKLDKILPVKQNILDRIRPATQGFEQVSCSAQPELRFLFGFGVLSAQEKKFLSQYDFVASSVRTDYDSIKLSGRGFIYIPSDSGEKSFVRPDQIDQPWKIEGILFRALVHEIGHMYGLQHTDFGVMRADYPETIIKKMHFFAFSKVEQLPSSVFANETDFKFSDGRVINIDKNIKVVRTQPKLLESSIVYFPSAITLEWSISSKNSLGDEEPLLIRRSPFLYEIYSVIENKIKMISRVERQCRPDSCLSDR